MITEAEIDEFISLRKEYEKIVTSKVLENCNKIVQIGAFTAELKEDGNIALS